jgi:nucleotide-binding universal stress UspA family protein
VSEERAGQISGARDTLVAAGFEVTSANLEGEVQTALSQYHRDQAIDLMVMGAWGHSRIRQFFVGSNTTRMLSHSDITLLLLR